MALAALSSYEALAEDDWLTGNVTCNVDHGGAPCPGFDTTGWQPYDGVYPLREEGWLMAPDKPIDDLEDDAPDVPNDEVNEKTPPPENDDDQPEKET